MSSLRTFPSATSLALRHAATQREPEGKGPNHALLDWLQASEALSVLLHQVLAKQSISSAGFLVLAALADAASDKILLSKLSGKMRVESQALLSVLVRLELAGLVQIHRSAGTASDPSPMISQQGRNAYEAILTQVTACAHTVLADMPTSEISRLSHHCQVIHQKALLSLCH